MSTIKVNGQVLDSAAQKSLADMIETYMYGLGRIDGEKMNHKDILERAKDELKINKSYVKNAATELYQEEQGKLNPQEKEEKEAAVAQIKEIYENEKLNNFGGAVAAADDDDDFDVDDITQ